MGGAPVCGSGKGLSLVLSKGNNMTTTQTSSSPSKLERKTSKSQPRSKELKPFNTGDIKVLLLEGKSYDRESL